jgi:superfamily II DNA or RNA helicase
MTLRDYQVNLKQAVRNQWDDDTVRNVLAVLPCGGGKTTTMAHLAAELDEPGLVQAHRQELVGQISIAFARVGMHHRIIAPDAVVREISAQHIDELGRNYVRPDASYAIAGVDTLIRRQDPFFDTVKHWQTDEAHHLLQANKWGRAVGMLGAARGIGWTATPCRGDRRSLRRGDGGCFDTLVQGPSMRELIQRRYLKEFRIYGCPQAIDVSGVRVGSGGDFNREELAEAAHKSAITGDIVEHAMKLAPGKKGVTFAVDVQMAEEHAQAFRDAGVRAAVISDRTSAAERLRIIRAYRGDGLDEVCNVDVLGEGFDLPGIVRASFARPTASYGLYVQQFGRALRPMQGEPVGIICDHVGNVARHKGPPDKPRAWSLDGLPPREAGEVPTRFCANPECMLMWEGFGATCPHCGWRPVRGSAPRDRPEILEGDLTLYDDEMMAALRGEVERISGQPDIPWGASQVVARSIEKAWTARAAAQDELSDVIDQWAGHWHAKGETLDAVYRRFWALFGMDTLSALTMSGPKQREMIERVRSAI